MFYFILFYSRKKSLEFKIKKLNYFNILSIYNTKLVILKNKTFYFLQTTYLLFPNKSHKIQFLKSNNRRLHKKCHSNPLDNHTSAGHFSRITSIFLCFVFKVECEHTPPCSRGGVALTFQRNAIPTENYRRKKKSINPDI